jgi:RNA polymerase sigma-70 factor (ECF subfamily)
VCGIAANVARSLVRRRLRHARRVQPLVAVPEPPHPEPDPTHDPERVALALAELPERYELALRMKYFERRSVAEMTAATGDTVKAAESLLARAREAFRAAYTRLGGDTP